MSTLTRFSVAPLHTLTQRLAAVAMGRQAPDLVITGARVLSTYTERIHDQREIWISAGRIAAVKPAGSCAKNSGARFFDAGGGILAPGLVDPHIHIESSMMTACAYAEAAFLNGRAVDALNQLAALKRREDLDFYQRARIEARMAAITPVVLEMQRQGIDPEEQRPDRQ
jgi:hypothetical protein